MKQTTLSRYTDGLLVFLIILLSSRASTIANSEITIFITLIINLIVMIRRRTGIDKRFAWVIPIFLLLIFQNWYQNEGHINVLRYIKLFALISIAYCTIKLVKFSFFAHYNWFIFSTILISLPFYCWQIISADSLHNLGMLVQNFVPWLVETQPSSQNILFYTIEFVDRYRNSGPMWEPGGFATMIVLAIYFEFLKTGFKFNKKLFVFFLGVFITFSTTGYLLAMILLFVFLVNTIRNKTSKIKFTFYVTIIPAFIFMALYIFFTTEIMYNKIMFLFDDQMAKVEDMQHVQDLNLDVKFSLGRFGSLLVDMASIKDNLIFGRGYDDDYFRHGHFESFNLTNGLSNYTARLGIIGLIWLIFSLYQSGRILELSLNGERRKNNILILIVLLIAFSNPVLFTPLYILLSFLFIPFKQTKKPTEIACV